MIKIAHVSDLHIHNTRYHSEYKAVFNKLYETLKNENVDFIINTGDTAHTKVNLSPEYFDMAHELFWELSKIAPVYNILGNHDGNVKSSSRLDAISPVIKRMNDVHLLKNSGEYSLTDDITLNVLSIFDKENWIVAPTDPNKINIALYHGTITGCRTDLGFQFQHGENDLDIFKNFDFALMGDIHKANQALDSEGRVRYAGSLVQQNHGETNDKGYLIWEIEDKDDFDVRHIQIDNPKPFLSLPLTKTGKVPEVDIPKGARLRLVANSSLTYPVIQKALQVAKVKYEAENVTFLNNSSDRSKAQNLVGEYKKEDLRDISVQEKLIKDYLKDFEPGEEVLEEILDLNRQYEAKISIPRNNNINFDIAELKWENLFRYGSENSINFDSLSGIVGIFGKNFIGKSSIIDILCFCIFGDITKKKRKYVNLLNNSKNEGYVEATLRISDKIFKIKRTLERKIAKRTGKELGDAKHDVYFYEIVDGKKHELNGTTVHETNRIIEKYFGTFEDFLLTGLASQKEPFKFIDERSTKRKEILGKFIGIKFFNEKYDLAHEDAKAHKGLLKKYQGIDFDTQIVEAKKDFRDNLIELTQKKGECENLKREVERAEENIFSLQRKLDTIPPKYKEVSEIEKKITDRKVSLKSACQANVTTVEKIKNLQETIKDKQTFIDSVKVEELVEDAKRLSLYYDLMQQASTKKAEHEKELKRLSKKGQLLNQVPCGDSFPNCSFIKDAHKAKNNINLIQETLKKAIVEQERTEKEYKELLDKGDPSQTLKKVKDAEYDIKANKQMLKALETEQKAREDIIANLKSVISKLEKEHVESMQHSDAVKNRIQYEAQIQQNKENLAKKKKEIKYCDSQSLKLSRQNGVLEHKIETLEKERTEKNDVDRKYQAFELYLKSVHPNGIPFNIIKNALPAINAELSEILADIVDFQIFFVHEDNRLDVFLQREGDGSPTLLELGSGAESTLSGMAIRLALIRISSIPLGDLFILDEPSFLDADNLEGFTRVLNIIKTMFKSVILISHLESLKDTVDKSIVIEQKDESSYINT